MKRRRLIALSAVFVTAITTWLIFSETVPVSAQNKAAPAAQPPPPPVYNPYPPGILPPDLTQEVDRVLREIRGIENEALGQWQALGPVTYTGNPPIIQGNGYEAMRILGKLMNYDQNISPFRNEACAYARNRLTKRQGLRRMLNSKRLQTCERSLELLRLRVQV